MPRFKYQFQRWSSQYSCHSSSVPGKVPRGLLASYRELEHAPGLCQQRPLRAHGARGVERRVGHAGPVHGLHVLLRPHVVGVEEGGHLGGVARAPGVLEQQRVEKRRAPLLVEPETVGDPHPHQTTADGMTLRQALHQVQRERERRENLGEPELPRVRPAPRPGSHRAHAFRITLGSSPYIVAGHARGAEITDTKPMRRPPVGKNVRVILHP